MKAPILSFLEPEERGRGRGIIMGAPRQLTVKSSINMKEIKVSPPMPNRVNLPIPALMIIPHNAVHLQCGMYVTINSLAKVIYPKCYNNSTESCTFLFLGRLGRHGNTVNFSNLLKYLTFVGGFFSVFMGKKNTTLEFLVGLH